MTSERWHQIEKLFHSALERPSGERAGFLSHECLGDEGLRKEVESLLRAHERDGSFLDVPAYEVAEGLLSEGFAGLTPGQKIGPYRILSLLASGGMGDVYLAYDDRLGRKIALKLLPIDFAKDRLRVRRFVQEARAASALSHPNVCVIHEIGQTMDGRHFIAMEHIEGVTLRERIAQQPFTLSEALSAAEQIAAALSAAHAGGVVHRDIKPENIMLRRDGYVKVLDFGLAKLTESESQIQNVNEAPTIAKLNTEPGTQMGTVRYMSPEQLREGTVDERTDVWSFGVVLHEMVTGFSPFEARSRNEVIAAILKREPTPLSFGDEVPEEFQRIVAKALIKDRKERYQTVNKMAADLKSFRRRIQGDSTEEPLWQVPDIEGSDTNNRGGLTGTSLEFRTRHRRKTSPGSSSDLWSSALTYVSRTAEQVISEIKGHPKTVFAGLAVVLAIIFGLNTSPVRRWFGSQQTIVAPFQNIKVTPGTNAGQSVCAAISPDGKSFAHAEKKNGTQELLLTNIASAGTVVVVPPSELKYRGITFSVDSNYLYFTTGERNEAGVLYQVSLPSGTPRKIKEGVDSVAAFSPAGDRFAFVRFNRSSNEYFLMIAAIDGSEERLIAARRDGSTFSLSGPAWSPDGQTIVCGAGKFNNMKLIDFNVEDGHEKPIGSQQWNLLSQVAWANEKSDLIISAREHWTSPFQIWRISYPDGEASRVTNDASDIAFETVSVSRDGNNIVAVENHQVTELSLTPNGDALRAKKITSIVGLAYGLNWNSRGDIVFSSMVGSNLTISSIDTQGSRKAQLTDNSGDNYTPATSPDGSLIAFTSTRGGRANIWRMNAEDGSNLKQLTFSDLNSYPTFSSDGLWVLYDNQSESPTTVWKVPVEGGSPVRLMDHARMPVVSPDNQFVALRYYPEGRSPEFVIMPFQGGGPVRPLPIPVREWQRLQWTPDSRALNYIDIKDGVSNIWSYDLVDGSTKPLTNFKSDQIYAYAWSPDFKQLASLRGTEIRDVMILSPK